jgi:hypothetical protein
MTNWELTLVLGGNGRTGRRVAARPRALTGRDARSSGGVAEAPGRAPGDFTDFAAAGRGSR